MHCLIMVDLLRFDGIKEITTGRVLFRVYSKGNTLRLINAFLCNVMFGICYY